MKTLVLYATRTGLSYKLARRLADELEAELYPISDGKNYSGFFGYIRAAVKGLKKDPGVNRPFELKDNLADYERLIITGPIWAENWCSINRSFLKEYGDKISCPVYFVFTHMSKLSYERCAVDADKYLSFPHKDLLSVSTKFKNDAEEKEYALAVENFINKLRAEKK